MYEDFTTEAQRTQRSTEIKGLRAFGAQKIILFASLRLCASVVNLLAMLQRRGCR
jgi:hypothetical protein